MFRDVRAGLLAAMTIVVAAGCGEAGRHSAAVGREGEAFKVSEVASHRGPTVAQELARLPAPPRRKVSASLSERPVSPRMNSLSSKNWRRITVPASSSLPTSPSVRY